MSLNRTSARHSRLRAQLAKVGLKATPQRLKVLDTLLSHERRHLSALDVHQSIADAEGGVGRATIYRVLAQLTDVGILTRHIFHDDPSKAVYEVQQEHQHDHLVCLGCGRVDEIVADDIAELSRHRAAAQGYSLSQHRLALYGYCAACAAAAPHSVSA